MNDEEVQRIKEEFNVENKLPNIPLIQDYQNLLSVPLSSVAVWVDPLDATKEFTGLLTFKFFRVELNIVLLLRQIFSYISV